MISFVLYSVCASAQALYNDSALYSAYKAEDMSLWGRYIESVDFSTASLTERQRCLNYEYGYVAAAIDLGYDDADIALVRFEQHIDALASSLPLATLLSYRSALCAYKAKVGQAFVFNAVRSMRLAQQACRNDSLNPLALTLQGNVFFYAPSFVGGSKQRALTYFVRASRIYEERGDTVFSWNYAASKMWEQYCRMADIHAE